MLYSGTADGTYYYDINTPCPQDGSYPETNGVPACASYDLSQAQTLAQLGSNNVVAIDRTLLPQGPGRAKLCGKKVLVYKDGQRVPAPDGGDFFVWDGCEACEGGVRIDFSVSGLKSVDPDACNLGVVPGVTFEVVDEQVQPFVL